MRKTSALPGIGLCLMTPIIETMPYWIDTRAITNSFKAKKLSRKTQRPVDVDAVSFSKVVDPQKSALDVADYNSDVIWASQTALRDVIGKTMLSDVSNGRAGLTRVSWSVERLGSGYLI